MKFDVRIEYPNGAFEDVSVNAASSKGVPEAFAAKFSQFTQADWRGLVVFVNGAKPCEDAIAERRSGLRG